MTETRSSILPVALLGALALASGCGDEGETSPGPTPEAACDSEPVVMTTDAGVEFVRTPDACFASLPDWPYEPHYVDIDGLRQAYVEAGPSNGPVVLLLHGQPTWSYLYRKMIPVLADAGYRVIAMDHLGMGRSDKPIHVASYSYLGHGDRLERFIQALELRDINLFVQDWGSLIGLRVVGLHPDWFARVAVGDGDLPVVPPGFQPYPPVEDPDVEIDAAFPFAAIPAQQASFYDGCELLGFDADFAGWMSYAMKARSFHPAEVLEALTWFDIPPAEEAAYDAPFPSRIYLAGPRVFPSLVNELAGQNQAAWEGLTALDKPFLALWSSNDPGGLGQCATQEKLVTSIPGALGQPHSRLPEASHFLQDDQGPEIARRLAQFFASGPSGPSIFNRRYCEVLLVDVQGSTATVSVFNTTSFNECPAEQWEALDAATIAQDEGVAAAVLNGPRRFALDSAIAGSSATGETKDFGGITMEKVAELQLPVSQLQQMQGGMPYTEVVVMRDNTWTFDAGREVYELVSPVGDTYVMQSFSQQIDPDLVRWELPLLGSKLALPAGWSFRAVPQPATLNVVATGEATVIQDELGNTYQKL